MTHEEKIEALIKEYNDPNTTIQRREAIKLQGRVLRAAIEKGIRTRRNEDTL